MRRTLAFLMLAALLPVLTLPAGPQRVSAAPATGWTKVYDQPAPPFSAVEMFDDSNGLAASAGALYHTIDGGASWIRSASDDAFIPSGPFFGPSYISYGDATHAWAAGANGTIWATTDGGVTFARQQTGTVAHFNSVSAVSATEAWASAFGEGFSDVGPFAVPVSVLLHTTDGGASWRSVRMSNYGVFGQVSFIDRDRGWLVASRCMPGQPMQSCPDGFALRDLLRTTDAGRSWSPVPVTGGGIPYRMQWFAGARGYIQTRCGETTGCTPGFFSTTDGGDTWAPVALPPGGQPGGDWRFVSAERGYVVDSRCETEGCPPRPLLETTDAGRRWRAVAGGAIDALAAFDATSTHVVAPGGATGIVRVDLTTLSVSESVTGARDAFLGIDFASRDRGYAVNRAGLWLTDDGGATWSPRAGSTSASHVSAPDSNTIWIAGAGAACPGYCTAVSRSIDGGATWSASPQRFGLIQGLQAFDATRAWAWGDGGLWRTDDGGAAWTLIDPAVAGGAYAFVGRDFGWQPSCGSLCRNGMRVTQDGGNTWQTLPLPDGTTPRFFLDRYTGWAVRQMRDTSRGGCPCAWSLLRTQDGGATWQDQYNGTEDGLILSGLLFVDQRWGWSRGSTGFQASDRIYVTTDTGVTWTEDLSGAFGKLSAKDGRLWLANVGPESYGFGVAPNRTTIWRRDYSPAPTVMAPDTGSGPLSRRSRGAVQFIILTLITAGGAAGAAGWRISRFPVH